LDPGSIAFLTPGSGIRIQERKKSESEIWDKHLGSYFGELINSFFGYNFIISLSIQWYGSGSGIEKSRSGIRDKHPRSATLIQKHLGHFPMLQGVGYWTL
jgi:hypothetical protein